MAPFTPRPQKKTPAGSSRSDIFSRYGNRITMNQFNQIISRIPMRPIEREYAKRVMEKFHHRFWSPGLNDKEFKQGLDEMLRNTHDPVGRHTIERIKKAFGL